MESSYYPVSDSWPAAQGLLPLQKQRLDVEHANLAVRSVRFDFGFDSTGTQGHSEVSQRHSRNGKCGYCGMCSFFGHVICT